MDCDASRERMMDLLYGEADEAARRAVEAHHGACAACAEEYAALRGLRRQLSAWTLPAAAPRLPLAPRRAWPGLAAAAAVLLAVGALAGAAAAGAELRHDAQGWTLRLGRVDQGALEARLSAQEARHQAEMREVRARLDAPAALDSARVLAAARELVERSERRQDERLRQAFGELTERSETQRRADLAAVNTNLYDLESKTGLRNARLNEMMGRVLLASQEK